MPRRTFGFTLIELLIVVAIIAILAAIAVPNFLEAQVRSKVSRVKSDMRVYATALEAYFTDYNKYPRDQDNDVSNASENGFSQLTTPVAYITTYLRDPFSQSQRNTSLMSSSVAAHYVLASGSNNNPLTGFRAAAYTLIALGPDVRDSSSGQDSWPANTNYNNYDPTNGTVSAGDIYRFGGDYRSGNWTIFNLPYQQWNPGTLLPN